MAWKLFDFPEKKTMFSFKPEEQVYYFYLTEKMFLNIVTCPDITNVWLGRRWE